MSKLPFIKNGPRFIWAYITWLKRYSDHPEKYPIEVRYAKVKKCLTKAYKHLKVDLKVNNAEYFNNQTESYLGICNHRFFIDPIYFIYNSDKPISFVAKKEVAKIPIIGRVIKALDGYFIDRDDLIGQARIFKKIAERLKKNDLSYFIFPEGTRMKNKDQIHTLPYKDGSLKPAYWANKKIIYCAMIGNERTLDKVPEGYKTRNITMTVFKPLEVKEFINQPTTKIMPMLEKRTNEELVKLLRENKMRGKK